MTGIIYCFTNPNNNKRYIGQTSNENARLKQHKWFSLKGGTPFYDDMKEIGFKNFKYEVLNRVEATTQSALDKTLNELERNYIKTYKSNNPEFGYNRDTGGGYKRDKIWMW